MTLPSFWGVLIVGCLFSSCSTTHFNSNAESIEPYTLSAQEKEPYKAPYVAQFQRKNKQLWFVAVDHTDEIESHTFKTIHKAIEEFKPQVIVIEGFEDEDELTPAGHFPYLQRVAKANFKGSSESSYAQWTALENHIPYAPSDPLDSIIANGFEMSGVPASVETTKKVMTFQDYEKEASQLGKNSFNQVKISDEFSFSEFLKWYQKHAGSALVLERVIQEDFSPRIDRNPTAFNRMSALTDIFREKHLNEVYVRMLNQFDRVMVVYDSGHLVKHRKAISEILGEARNAKWF